MCHIIFVVFSFKQKTAYVMRVSDWSSDVCSSDLHQAPPPRHPHRFRAFSPIDRSRRRFENAAIGGYARTDRRKTERCPMRPSEQASPAAIRRERVFALRETGLTFREIGEREGISSSRASQIHADAVRQRSEEHTYELQ